MQDATGRKSVRKCYTITERRPLQINGVTVRLVLSGGRKGRRATLCVPEGTKVVRLDHLDSVAHT